MALGPAPDGREPPAVARRGGEQQRVRLALADRVAALVAADDAPVDVDVAVEEARRGGARRGAGGGRAVRAAEGRQRDRSASERADRRERERAPEPARHAALRSASVRSSAATVVADPAPRSAGAMPAARTVTCTSANAALFSVPGSCARTSPYIAAATSTVMAAPPGSTARGWRPDAPRFGVTLNDPGRRSSTASEACTWIQNDAACSAKARNV